ncbi:unnamed protein product [Cylicocyclus nassatus]|uniref:Uncharacterized protein n=1 Tax=Cylicocyclus nassatus TaxID=53992 RepID=A0AA36GP72_CYLNA|nr:unnamed protein product [Cylicocyclus nassatus]
MVKDTPVYPIPSVDRQRKRRLQFDETPPRSPDLDEAANSLLLDDNFPLYARTIIGYLLESRKQMESIVRSNRELMDEVKKLSDQRTSRKPNQLLWIKSEQIFRVKPPWIKLDGRNKKEDDRWYWLEFRNIVVDQAA